MHRIDHPTAVGSPPAPDAPGTPGYFTAGNPQTSVPATVVTKDWANDVQENICGVIEGAGYALDKGNYTQLRQAILKMVQDTNSAVIIAGATFEASVANGEAVRWDSANNRFDEAIADGSANGNALGIADVTNAKVYAFGSAALFAGLTPGAKYYLSDTVAGAITTNAPAGHKVILGIAKSATELFVDIDQEPISTRQYVDVRQTTLSGRIDQASGQANFLEGSGSALEVHIRATAAEPLIVTFAHGSDGQGAVDYVSPPVTADILAAWTPPANSLSLLYIDRNIADGTITRGHELGIHGRGAQEGYVRTPIDSTPTMTSNTAPYGVASASSENSSQTAPWKAFNKLTGVDDGWVSLDAAMPQWLRYQWPVAQTVKRYSIRSRNSANRGDPNNWTLEGSNNGTDWVVIDTRTGEGASWGQSEKRVYECAANNTSYLHYRVNVTSVSLKGAGTYVSIDELELMAVQSFFSIPDMKMYEWAGGTTWTEKNRRFVGECVSGGSSITSTTTYALRGEFVSPITAVTIAVGVNVSFSHKIGATGVTFEILARESAAYRWAPLKREYDGANHIGYWPVEADNNTVLLTPGSSGYPVQLMHGAYSNNQAAGNAFTASGQLIVKARRGW